MIAYGIDVPVVDARRELLDDLPLLAVERTQAGGLALQRGGRDRGTVVPARGQKRFVVAAMDLGIVAQALKELG